MKRSYEVTPLPGFTPEIGRALWALEEVRRSTLAAVNELPAWVLDWQGPDGDENAIGSLLYHIALVELSWLFLDILEQEFPPEVRAEFPYPMGSEVGGLTPVLAVPLEDHLVRLARSRSIFLDALRGFTVHEWRRERGPSDVDYRVTPEWAVFHLVEHEAGHMFQIRALRARAERHAGRG